MTTTLAQARHFVAENREEGVSCPCCDQFAKIYTRALNSQMARVLITMHRTPGDEQGFMHLPTVLGRKQADEAKLVHWELIEDSGQRREDQGRAGWWRITPAGRQFVLGALRVHKYIRLYDSRFQGFDGPWITIEDALGTRFNYAELMGWT